MDKERVSWPGIRNPKDFLYPFFLKYVPALCGLKVEVRGPALEKFYLTTA